VGNVNENDAKLAKSSKSVIYSFRVKKDKTAEVLIERDKIKFLNSINIWTSSENKRINGKKN
jgi:translation initiation factor IF-2